MANTGRPRARRGGNSSAPTRRNPPRNRQATRRPDSPVTYAPQGRARGSDIEASASDSDDSSSAHQFSPAQQRLTLESRNSSVELLDGPPQYGTVMDNGEMSSPIQVAPAKSVAQDQNPSSDTPRESYSMTDHTSYPPSQQVNPCRCRLRAMHRPKESTTVGSHGVTHYYLTSTLRDPAHSSSTQRW